MFCVYRNNIFKIRREVLPLEIVHAIFNILYTTLFWQCVILNAQLN